MQIHYFQRFHSKENVDTANTMLMLSRLYNYDVDKFFSMLNSLILNENNTPELSFDLQVGDKESIPDVVISQKSMKIVVETKLYNQFGQNQLERHLSKFSNEEIKVLLTLDPKPMDTSLKEMFELYLKDYNRELIKQGKNTIEHVNLTFEQLVSAMEDIIDNGDFEILSVLEDYKNYCFEEKLIPDDENRMRAIAAGTTLEDNILYNMYYDQASRGYSPHGYIGLYKDKSVQAIGKLSKTIIAWYKDGEFDSKTEIGEEATEDELKNIKEIIQKAESEHGYDLKTVQHRYFLVDKFYRTDFKKASKYPIQRSKFFNLSKILKNEDLSDTKEIAAYLNGKTWEEFGV